MERLRVHAIPYSTNVERVTLAAAIKGLEVDLIEHDPADRDALVALSGQQLVPVAEFGGEVVADSIAILRRLEATYPEPALWPADPAARAEAEIFIEWFNEVWKRAPNALDADGPPPDGVRHTAATRASVGLFEAMLGARRWLVGESAGIADVCAYPFLRYAVDKPADDDDERFHAILHELLAPGSHPRLDDWVARVRRLLAA